jgi:hypothetical protein
VDTLNDKPEVQFRIVAAVLFCILSIGRPAYPAEPVKVSVDWAKTTAVSNTTPTLAMVSYPILRQSSPIHDQVWSTLKELHGTYVRYQLWQAYPRLSVAELEPPSKEKTSWDFSLIDPGLITFLETTKGKEPIVQFSTIPAWMFKTAKPVSYPDDPNQITAGSYSEGTELVDSTGRQVADYFARVASWYTEGGFTDENGAYHRSGYHFDLPWWGVLNETQAEHRLSPQQYVLLYDAIVSAVGKVSPKTRFTGPALAPMGFVDGAPDAEYFQYFLDPRNHQSGIPLDMLAYHFYAAPSGSQSIDSWQYSFFDQADGFLNVVRLVETIRKRLSPSTRVDLDELGILLPEDWTSFGNAAKVPSIPAAYWNLYGAFFAYLYMELANIGIDVASLSEFINPPGNQPRCSLLNWKTGRPRASFRVLELLNANFGPGDKLAATDLARLPPSDVAVQAFITSKGKKLLVINKRAYAVDVSTAAVGRAIKMAVVDVKTGEDPPRMERLARISHKYVQRRVVRAESTSKRPLFSVITALSKRS